MSERKTKLIALRITPTDHAAIQKLIERRKDSRGHYWRFTSVSEIICRAIEDFLSGEPKNRIEMQNMIAESERLAHPKKKKQTPWDLRV